MPPKATAAKSKPSEDGGKGKSRAKPTKKTGKTTVGEEEQSDVNDASTKGLSGQKLPLPAWLKTFTDRGVDMRLAMTMAGKLYSNNPSLAQIGKLNGPKLMEVGITDKDQKRAITTAIRGLKLSFSAAATGGEGSGSGGTGGHLSPASAIVTKKRKWKQDDLSTNPLIPGDPALRKGGKAVEYDVSDFDFHENHDIEAIRAQTVVTNRAPCMTAWAYIISEKMGFDRLEALSLASTFTSVTSTKHALALGNIYTSEQARDAQLEMDELPQPDGKRYKYASDGSERDREGGGGHSQPWVSIMKRSPVIQRADGTWRGVLKGMPVEPYRAHSYISRNFREATPYVIGALRLLAECYTVDELQERGYGMYVAFRPDVAGWGDRATLFCSNIIDMVPSETKEGIVVKGGETESKVRVKAQGDDDGGEGEESEKDKKGVATTRGTSAPRIRSGQEGVKVEDEVQAEREDAAEVEGMKGLVSSTSAQGSGSVTLEQRSVDLDGDDDVFEGLDEAEYDEE